MTLRGVGNPLSDQMPIKVGLAVRLLSDLGASSPTGRWLLPDQTSVRFGPAAPAPGCRPKRAPTRWGLGMHHGPWGAWTAVARQAPTASQRSAPWFYPIMSAIVYWALNAQCFLKKLLPVEPDGVAIAGSALAAV